MTSKLLNRHPSPLKGETLFPYILRLTQVNGYDTPGRIISYIGNRHAFRSTFDLRKLAAAANRTFEESAEISYSSGHKSSRAVLLGHEVRPHDLRLQNPQVCPECVEKSGIIEAHFELGAMIACPLHGTVLLSGCPNCRHPMTWLRPRLLQCRCGADLSGGVRAVVSQPVRDLLDIVRRKVHRLPMPDEYSSGIPCQQLGIMCLRSLLFSIESIGRRRGSSPSGLCEYEEIVSHASTVLSDWPNNLFRYLDRLTPDKTNESELLLTEGEIKSLYQSLQKIKPIEDANFFRKAISLYAINHRGRGSVVAKIRASELKTANFMSKPNVARLLGVCDATIDRLVRDGLLSPSRTKRGRRATVWFAVEDVRELRKEPGNVYSNSEAARMLGVPESVLRILRSNSDFRVSNLLKGSHGFHERDIATFKSRLMALRSERGRGNFTGEFISFSGIVKNTHCTAQMKADMVSRVLSGALPVVGCHGNRHQGLFFSKEQFLKFMRCDHSSRLFEKGQGVRTPADALVTSGTAARVLQCSPRAIPRLMHLGHLQGQSRAHTKWINSDSLAKFESQFIRINSLASRLHLSSLALIRVCKVHQIPLVVCELKGKRNEQQCFVSKRDERRICEYQLKQKR